jgi:hypothetical protein
MRSNSHDDLGAFSARLDAVERAVAAGDGATSDDDSVRVEPAGAGDPADDEAEPAVETAEALGARVTALEAELDAVRGLLDAARAVDESVERRADIALAKVERLESSTAADPGLVVERVPVDDAPEPDPTDSGGRRDAPAEDGPESDGPPAGVDGAEADATSLAERLREALG